MSRLKKIANNEDDMSLDEVYEETIQALDNMKKNVSNWAVRDTLTKFTSWDFYSGSAMASIDEETALDIVKQLESYVESIRGSEEIFEVYDIVYSFAGKFI